jgi:hypothetical protein
VAAVAESCPVAAMGLEVFDTGLLAVDGHPLDIARARRAVAQIRPTVAGGVGVGTDCAEFVKLKALSWNRNCLVQVVSTQLWIWMLYREVA